MNNLLMPVAVFLLLTWQLSANAAVADSVHQSKVYVVNGKQWPIPAGRSADVFSPKFSSSLGLDISLRNRHYFLNPSLDFMAFGYNQQIHDPEYTNDIADGRSSFYILNLTGGMRRQLRNVNTYVFAGPTIGYILEPRADVIPSENLVNIENIWHLAPGVRGGAGADYKLGSFFLFAEVGWLYNFLRIEERSVHMVILQGGLKTDITRITKKVVEVLGGTN